MKYLDKVSILDALLAEEKKQVANALVEMHFASADRIIQQGEPGNMFLGFVWGAFLCGSPFVQPGSSDWMIFFVCFDWRTFGLSKPTAEHWGSISCTRVMLILTRMAKLQLGWLGDKSGEANLRCADANGWCTTCLMPTVDAVLLGLTRVYFLLSNVVYVICCFCIMSIYELYEHDFWLARMSARDVQ